MLLILIVAVVSFPGCTGETRRSAPEERPIKIALVNPPATLNPMTAVSASSQEIIDVLYRGLVDWNDRWEPYAEVAVNVPSFSNGGLIKRGKASVQLNFQISKLARWSNGLYLDSSDFIFFNQMAAYPSFAALSSQWRDRIKTIQTRGENRLEIVWFGADPGSMKCFKALPQKTYGGDITKNPMSFFKEPVKWQQVINGPYEIKNSKIKNEKILSLSLSRNEEYYRKKPSIGQFDVTFFSTREALESDLAAGNLDVIPALSFEQGLALVKNADYSVHFTPSTSLACATLNTQSENLGDLDIRRALLLSLKREELVKILYQDKGAVAQSWLPVKHPAYVAAFQEHAPNQNKAIELLKKSGWTRLAGESWKKGDRILRIRIVCSNDPFDREILAFLKENWERLGVKVEEAKGKEPAGMIPDVCVTSLDVPPWVNPGSIFSPGSLEPNLAAWTSPENDQICAAFNEKIDGEQKIEQLKAQQVQVAKEIPLIPLLFKINVSACKKKIANFKPRGFGTVTWNIEDWAKNK